MKHLLVLLTGWLLWFSPQAQNLYTMQYWFDGQYNTRQSVYSTVASWQSPIDVSGLSEGIHTLSLHVQDSSGLWTSPCSFIFYKNITLDDSSRNQFSTNYTLWYDHDYATHQSGTIGNGNIMLDVSQLGGGIHSLSIQLGEGRTAQLQEYIFFVANQQSIDNTSYHYTMNYTLWYDHDYTTRQSGTIGNGNIMLDVSQLGGGIHSLSIQLGEGRTAQLQEYIFYIAHLNLTDSLEQITQYDYVLNDNELQRHLTHVNPCDTLRLMTILPVEPQAIRSSCFHFEHNVENPTIYAKNDIRIRFWEANHRFAEYKTQYVDYNIVDTIHADTLERDTTKVIVAPMNNTIHWFKLAAGVGDSLSFHTDRRCTMQLYAPSGEMVFHASGDSVLSWSGCHAWESGVYYLAVHDAADTGNVAVTYQWIYRYAVVSWDVHRVGNGGISTITFEGNGFAGLDTVYLIKGTDTLPTLYIGREKNTQTAVVFNFENADTGIYRAVFVYVDETLNKSNVVTVETAIPIVLTSTCSFPETFLRGSTVTYTYTITNTGNMTAYNVPLYTYIGSSSLGGISHIKYDGLNLPSIIAGFDMDSLSANDIAELREWAEEMGDDHYFFKLRAFDSISGDSIWVRSNYFFLTMEPYETKVLSLNLTSTVSVDVWFTLPDTISPLMYHVVDTILHPLCQMPQNSSTWGEYDRDGYCCVRNHITCVLDIISSGLDIAELIADASPNTPVALTIQATGCIIGLINDFNSSMGRWLCEEEMSEWNWSDYLSYAMDWESVTSTAIKCVKRFIPNMPGKKIIELAEKLTDMVDNILNYSGYSHASTVINCLTSMIKKEPGCPPIPPQGGESSSQQPSDPNDIIGYLAESGSHAVGHEQSQLYYSVEFENDTTFATANAHTVVVIDTLDGNVFDLGSFAATSVSIGEQVVSLNGERNFIRTVDMRPAINVLAQVQLEFDDTAGIARWTFRSLDPMTLLETTDPTLGFLPANFNGDGVGQVDFLINHKNNLTDSTIIANRAHIIFDNEAPIATSTWVNIMDITPPVSTVDSVAFSGGMATVAMSATDNLSGVWRYNVYGQMDSLYLPLAMNVLVDSMATFVADTDMYIAILTTAIDSAGNVEPLHLIPLCTDTTIVESITVCDSLTWHGTTYTASTNTPSYTTQIAHGCDSITTLHLTVNYSNATTETLTTCDSLTWHDNTYTASTTTPTFTSLNAEGCDSVTTLHLTVNYSNTVIESLTACDSLTWHDSTYKASTSTPTYTMQNIYGCDSTVTLNLTINYSVRDTLVKTAVGCFLWNGLTLTESGMYPYEGETSEGCDSIVILNLIVIHDSTHINKVDGNGIRLYPNPTKASVTIEGSDIQAVRVYSAVGQEVLYYQADNRNSLTLDMDILLDGFYIFAIYTLDGTAYKKVVKRD